MYRLLFLMMAALLPSCATINMLPSSASVVDFEGIEGKMGWSEYKQVERFRNHTVDQVYTAAKAGLGQAGFSLRKADVSSGLVIGEHGMTMHDWNIMAGVYFKQQGQDTKVVVIVEGSKDIGFSGDVTSDGWTGQILKGMRDYLNNNY